MRDVLTGVKTNERYRTQETVEKLNTDERECTMLYAEGDQITVITSYSIHYTKLYEGLDLAAGAEIEVEPRAARGGVKIRVLQRAPARHVDAGLGQGEMELHDLAEELAAVATFRALLLTGPVDLLHRLGHPLMVGTDRNNFV